MRFFRLGFVLLAVFLAPSASTARANTSADSQTLFPVDKDGKWGFIDATGKIVIPLKFEQARYFSEGLACVKVGDKYGFINEHGDMVIAPKYDSAWSFREGLAEVEEHYGPSEFIDKTGKVAFVPPSSHRFIEFRDGLAQGRSSFYGDSRYQPSADSPLMKTGWIDHSGKWAIEPRFKGFWDFSEGLAAVTFDALAPAKTGKMGFINKRGQVVIAGRFDSATYFSEGVAMVKADGRAFFVDPTGKRAFEGDFEDASNFHDRLACVQIGGKWGFIDHKGRLVIPPLLEEESVFFNGRADFTHNGKTGYIDKHGQTVVPAIYDYGHFFLGELASVTFNATRGDGSGSGYINRDGKVVWAPQPKDSTLPTTKQN